MNNNTNIEKEFLSGLINNTWLVNKTKLEPKHFFDLKNALIFSEIVELVDGGHKPEWSIVSGRIKKEWAEDHISSIILAEPSDNYENIAHSIINAHTSRLLVQECKSVLQDIEAGKKANSVLIKAIDNFSGIANETVDKAETMTKSMIKTMAKIKEPAGKHNYLVPTGIQTIDNVMGGFPCGMLSVIGADTSMGKTAVMLNMLMNIANAGTPLYLATMEDPAHSVNLRVLSRFSGVEYSKLSQHKELTLEEIQALERAQELIKSDNVTIDDSTGQNVQRLKRTFLRLKAQNKLGIVFIDHLTELSDQFKVKESTSYNFQQLRDIAKDLDIPIVVLVQVNRETMKNHNGIPKMSNLVASYVIEQMSRVVMLLYRPHKYDASADKTELHIILAKNTNGATGTLKIKGFLNVMTIRDKTDEEKFNDGYK